MKLIIDIPKDVYEEIMTHNRELRESGKSAYYFEGLIQNGIPYEPEGDLISRKALKDITYINKGNFNTVEGIREWIDNAPTVEPCYQTTSCLDCGNYDKENHNCPRYCEVIKEAINSRPQGEWIIDQEGDKNTITLVTCPFCGERHCCKMNFCGNCGADMRK